MPGRDDDETFLKFDHTERGMVANLQEKPLSPRLTGDRSARWKWTLLALGILQTDSADWTVCQTQPRTFQMEIMNDGQGAVIRHVPPSLPRGERVIAIGRMRSSARCARTDVALLFRELTYRLAPVVGCGRVYRHQTDLHVSPTVPRGEDFTTPFQDRDRLGHGWGTYASMIE